MNTLVIATRSEFRLFILGEIVSNSRACVAYESSKNFKVDYPIDFRADEINSFYRSKFLSKNPVSCRFVDIQNVNDDSLKDLIGSFGHVDKILLTGANYVNRSTLHFMLKHCNLIANLHFGDSCEYRGLDSNYWSALQSLQRSPAVTLHLVAEKLDTGDIIKKIKLDKTFSSLSFFDLLEFEIKAAQSLVDVFYHHKIEDLVDMSYPQPTSGIYRSAMSSELKKYLFDSLLSAES